MKLEKAMRRERKIERRRNGMVVDGASNKDITRLQKERSEKIKRERERKNKELEKDE